MEMVVVCGVAAVTLILFDIDGTLTATNAVDAKCYASAFEKVFGFALPTTDWDAHTHCTDCAIAQEAVENHRSIQATQSEIDAFERQFVTELEAEFAANPRGFAEIPGAKRILEAIGAHPATQAALATGGMRGSACYKMARIGVDAMAMPAGFANDDLTREGIARCAIARANGHASDLVYVGDGPWDARTSAVMGMRFIGITGDASSERLRAQGTSVFLNDFLDQDAFFDAVRTATIPHGQQEVSR